MALYSAYGSSANLSNKFVAFGYNDVANSGTLSTSFATTLGDTYTLRFDYGAVGAAVATELDYSINGTSAALAVTGQRNFDTIFTSTTTSFVGTGGNVTLAFSSKGAAKSVDAILDNVSVVRTAGSGAGAALPEPASWAMMIASFFAVGAGMRRRSQVAAIG